MLEALLVRRHDVKVQHMSHKEGARSQSIISKGTTVASGACCHCIQDAVVQHKELSL